MIWAHEKMLREKVFYTDTRWPQYNLLLSDIQELAQSLPKGSKITGMERTKLYGGYSIVAPFFADHDYRTLEMTPIDRNDYNAIDDPRFIKIKPELPHEEADCVLVYNLAHHYSDPKKLLELAKSQLKKGGFLYLFEPTLRELHQEPAHYWGWTPYGAADLFERCGLEIIQERRTGGPFTAAIYVIDQTNQYVHETEKALFTREDIQDAVNKDKRENQMRKWTSFPTAFSIIGKK